MKYKAKTQKETQRESESAKGREQRQTCYFPAAWFALLLHSWLHAHFCLSDAHTPGSLGVRQTAMWQMAEWIIDLMTLIRRRLRAPKHVWLQPAVRLSAVFMTSLFLCRPSLYCCRQRSSITESLPRVQFICLQINYVALVILKKLLLVLEPFCLSSTVTIYSSLASWCLKNPVAQLWCFTVLQVLFSDGTASLPWLLLLWSVISQNVYEHVPESGVNSFHAAVGFYVHVERVIMILP